MADNAKLDCLVAGDANMDLIIEGAPPLQFGKELNAQSMDLWVGGSSAITAHNLARLGARVGFAGVLGNDAFAALIRAKLSAAGVDLDALRSSTRQRTGITVWHVRDGKRAGITYTGTTTDLQPRDIPSALLERSRHLHIGHYFLLSRMHSGAVRLFRNAHRLGLTTSVDCNYDPSETWDSGLRELLRYTDIFFPNEDEARRMTGLRHTRRAAEQLAQTVRIVAVKRGAKGALICSAGSCFDIPAKPARVVDAVGAGDSFNAGFLSRFLQHASLEECGEAGVRAGARCVAYPGGLTAFESK